MSIRYGLLAILPAVLSLTCGRCAVGAPPATRPVEGLRENPSGVVALVGAQVIRAPGDVPTVQTVVIRAGVIASVGPDVQAPPDARIVDLSGKTLYPGFLDAYGETNVDRSGLDVGTAHWNAQITPQVAVHQSYSADAGTDEMLRSQGIVARLVAPADGILKGQSALVLTAAEDSSRAVIAESVALHVRLTAARGRGREQYPNSPMGAVALARQTMLDADWYRRAWQTFQADPASGRPEQNASLAALEPYLSAERPVIIDAQNELYALRADRFAREFGLKAVLHGSGNEYRRLSAIRQTGRTLIVPVDFPKPPNVASAEDARHVTLEQLMHWRLAPENPGRLYAAGVPFALTSHGLDDRKQFLAAVRKAIERGLPKEAALAALTTTPANLLGVSDQLGSIAPGKAAHLVVTDGDVFEKKTKVLSVWIDGKEYHVQRPPSFDVRGAWDVRLSRRVNELRNWRLELSGKLERLKGTLVVEAPQTPESGPEATGMPPEPPGSDPNAEEVAEKDKGRIELKDLSVNEGRLTASFDTKPIGLQGRAMLSLVVSWPQSEAPRMIGYVSLPSGQRIDVTATRTEESVTDEDGEEEKKDGEDDEDDEGDDQAQDEADEDDADGDSADQGNDQDEDGDQIALDVAVNFPLGAFGRAAPPEEPQWLVFRHATVWTCGPLGILHDASVLVHSGRVEAVGPDDEIEVPEGAVEIDASGKHLTPGIIDCHSHMATDGGVNESSQAITAEVRIGDFIDSDDITIYRQLAGGVTGANVLHGSANPIGGQNQVIKLRWGALPEEMKMDEAPQGIKFALGENVKQSNWGERFSTRYPQTRMGVEQIIRDAFHAAQDYQRVWEAWQRERRGLPPRRDLELEAIAEILRGERWIHCHSYRQDEILALLRTLEDFGITIGSLQHILEGYKVAPEMAAHGATGSSFSDWWAYKFEVYDAIPFNGALMHEAGIVVSFNSDDQELGRHLNHEAAKAVKYGGVPEEEALKFVTLNPAKQLRIDSYVGSIEPGKHADLVVWSGPPLSLFSRCEQTWIDGRKYFDLKEDDRERRRVAELRASLVQAVLRSGDEMAKPGEEEVDEADLWPREDLFCGRHGHYGMSHFDQEASQ